MSKRNDSRSRDSQLLRKVTIVSVLLHLLSLKQNAEPVMWKGFKLTRLLEGKVANISI